MSKLIYLETDEEITDVIDKISKVEDRAVSLVIPRGSTLANSIVNLKLLVKRSKSLKKEVALVTNDNIAHNLASQIGLPVYESIDDAKAGAEMSDAGNQIPEVKSKMPLERVEEIDGVRVHQYDRDGSEDMEVSGQIPDVDNQIAEEMPAENTDIIEAVRDADENIGGGAIIEEKLIEEADSHPEPIPESPAELSDYKIIKKPMEAEMKQRDLSRPDISGDQVFGKMRTAKSRKKIIIWSVFGFIALLLIFGAYIVLPKATVTVSVISKPFTSTADIKVSKNVTAIDSGTSTIPGKALVDEEDLTKPFAASGTKNIGQAASGKVTVYNNWDQNAVSLPTGSKFVSTSGTNFVSTATASIPGATVGLQNGQFVIISSGTADVNVQATDVGDAGNIAPTNFTITSLPAIQQSKIYGKSTAAMTGGTNQVVKIITDKDISDAKTSTENELQTTIINKLKSGLPGNEKLLDSAILPSITSESASAKTGDQVDTFNYTAKIKVDAIVFSEDDFRTILLASANSKLAADEKIVTNDSESVKYVVGKSDVANGSLTLSGTFDGFTSGKYDTEAMKSAIKFKSVNNATNILSGYSGVLSANIVTTPKFLRTLPALTRGITIDYNYGK